MADLMRSRKFAPFFWTQFFGAFNDNVFKNALVILIAFKTVNEAESGLWINLASGLFILPFILFSPLAGQICDKYEKARVIRIIKLYEIVIMAFGAVGFYWGNTWFLIAVLFFMGLHSTFFGPIKYSILPQHLTSNEIMTGTSLVEMGTFLAILLGTILGALLVKSGLAAVCIGIIGIALLGWLTSLKIPKAPPVAPHLKLNYNPGSEIKNLYRIASKESSVYYAIFNISWFWAVGATILAQLPTLVKHTLRADEYVVTLFLAIFTLSISLGAYVSSKISDSKFELGIVPLGALGITLSVFDLGIIDYRILSHYHLDIMGFLLYHGDFTPYRIMIDLGFIGFFGSFFIVPLYALLQFRSEHSECSRVIAANNIINSIFIVGAAGLTMFLYGLELDTAGIFVVFSLANLLVTGYVFVLQPEMLVRFLAWGMAKTVYKVRYFGRQKVPLRGAVLLGTKNISLRQKVLATAACQRPVYFLEKALKQRSRNLEALLREKLAAGAIVALPTTSMQRRERELWLGLKRYCEEQEIPVLTFEVEEHTSAAARKSVLWSKLLYHVWIEKLRT
jgi:MFS family permease